MKTSLHTLSLRSIDSVSSDTPTDDQAVPNRGTFTTGFRYHSPQPGRGPKSEILPRFVRLNGEGTARVVIYRVSELREHLKELNFEKNGDYVFCLLVKAVDNEDMEFLQHASFYHALSANTDVILHEIEDEAFTTTFTTTNLSVTPTSWFILYDPATKHFVTDFPSSYLKFSNAISSKKADVDAKNDYDQLQIILSNLPATARLMEAKSVINRLIRGWWVVYMHLKYEDRGIIGILIQKSSSGDESYATQSTKEGVSDISIAARKYLAKQLEKQLL